MAQHRSLRLQNAILARLPANEWDRLEADLQLIDMPVQKVLHGLGASLKHAHFPLSGSVSFLVELCDGFSAEVATVGNNGMVGIPLVLGQAESVAVARVQIAGTALRIAADRLIEQAARLPTLHRSLMHHAGVQMARAMQLAACNAHHSLDSRLARCLLSLHDRSAGQPIALTHDGLAILLCAHRPSISVSLQRLQQRGLIQQHKGSLAVVDRAGLERASCECYAVVYGSSAMET